MGYFVFFIILGEFAAFFSFPTLSLSLSLSALLYTTLFVSTASRPFS
jgi:hypothetical protein